MGDHTAAAGFETPLTTEERVAFSSGDHRAVTRSGRYKAGDWTLALVGLILVIICITGYLLGRYRRRMQRP